jgi:hypothetical protein
MSPEPTPGGRLSHLGERCHMARALAVAGLVVSTTATLVLLVLSAPSGLPPHIACWRGAPGLTTLHLVGDLTIWAAYAAIPFLLLHLMVMGRVDKSSGLTFPSLVVWGALFVWCCGQTHLLDAIEIWWEVQWCRGAAKLLAGIVSWVFVVLLLRHRRRLLVIARAVHRAVQEEEGTC